MRRVGRELFLGSVAAPTGASTGTDAALQSGPDGRRRDAATDATACAIDDRLTFTLLGRFACRIGRREVVFARRRDQNVLIYVALSPDARVTREELISVFWPDVAHGIARQGLRTTLSRLRRSIGGASGGGAARYVQIDAEIALDLRRSTVDARRFAHHAARGEELERCGDIEGAYRQYAAAEELYGDRLLSSEAVEAALAPYVRDYAHRFTTVLERLVHLSAEKRNLHAGKPANAIVRRPTVSSATSPRCRTA